MPDEARELLKRLVHCDEHNLGTGLLLADTRAFLAREQDGPVAEGWITFEEHEGQWFAVGDGDPGGGAPGTAADGWLALRVPVPAHVWNPPTIVGSVVENQEGNK